MTRTLNVAIVDDDDGVRASLSSLVRSLGHRVRDYGSAAAFLDALPSHAPDCLISDVQMPQMTGEQLQAELAAGGYPFAMVFMTGFPTPDIRRRVLAAGACAYLDKPIDAAAIADCLARLQAEDGR